MNSVSDLSPELKGLVLRRSSGSTDADSIKNQIASVQSQLADLQSAAASDTKSVTAPASGYFSGTVDGYESVLTPDALQTLTVSQYNALQPQTVSKQNAGKLISGDTWYYVTVVPAGETADVEQGDTVQVSFARDFYNQIAMKVARIGDSEAGYRVLVLSCSEYMRMYLP